MHPSPACPCADCQADLDDLRHNRGGPARPFPTGPTPPRPVLPPLYGAPNRAVQRESRRNTPPDPKKVLTAGVSRPVRSAPYAVARPYALFR